MKFTGGDFVWRQLGWWKVDRAIERVRFRLARGRWPCATCDRPMLCRWIKDGTQPCQHWRTRR